SSRPRTSTCRSCRRSTAATAPWTRCRHDRSPTPEPPGGAAVTGSQDDRRREPVPDLDSLLRLIDRSAYRDQLADVQGRRQRFFEALASHEDPMWREI